MDRPSPYLTTREAATYLRFGTTSAIRTLVWRGELRPSGAGSNGVLLFRIEELDRFVHERLRRRGYRPDTDQFSPTDVQTYRRIPLTTRVRRDTNGTSPAQPVGPQCQLAQSKGEELELPRRRVPSHTSRANSSPPLSSSGEPLRGAARRNVERARKSDDRYGLRAIVKRVCMERAKGDRSSDGA